MSLKILYVHQYLAKISELVVPFFMQYILIENLFERGYINLFFKNVVKLEKFNLEQSLSEL